MPVTESQAQGLEAPCPSCDKGDTKVAGRVGQRLVFDCSRCNIKFFRNHETALSTRVAQVVERRTGRTAGLNVVSAKR